MYIENVHLLVHPTLCLSVCLSVFLLSVRWSTTTYNVLCRVSSILWQILTRVRCTQDVTIFSFTSLTPFVKCVCMYVCISLASGRSTGWAIDCLRRFSSFDHPTWSLYIAHSSNYAARNPLWKLHNCSLTHACACCCYALSSQCLQSCICALRPV